MNGIGLIKREKYSPGYEMKSFLETLRAIPCDLDWPRPALTLFVRDWGDLRLRLGLGMFSMALELTEQINGEENQNKLFWQVNKNI